MVIRNRYAVQSKRWNKWSRAARSTFNDVFRLLLNQETANSAPDAPTVPREAWRTIAWNAAWIAADAVLDFEHARTGETT